MKRFAIAFSLLLWLAPSAYAAPVSLWYPNAVTYTSSTNGTNYTIATKIEFQKAGTVTDLTFYKTPSDTTTSRKMIIWSSDGSQLNTAQCTTASEPTTGLPTWVTCHLATPFSVSDSSIYYVSSDSPNTMTQAIQTGNTCSQASGVINDYGPFLWDAGSLGWQNYQVRNTIAGSQRATPANQTQMRFTFETYGTASSATLYGVYVGFQGTGNPYNFSATPTHVTFNGGSDSFTVASGDQHIVSDWINFTDDTTKTLVVSNLWSGTAADTFRRGSTGADAWYVSGTTNSSALNPTETYTELGRLLGILKIETRVNSTTQQVISCLNTDYATALSSFPSTVDTSTRFVDVIYTPCS